MRDEGRKPETGLPPCAPDSLFSLPVNYFGPGVVLGTAAAGPRSTPPCSFPDRRQHGAPPR